MSNNLNSQSPSDFAESLLSRISNEPGWFHYDALNKAEPLGRQLKPWGELDEQQKATIVLHVNDMSLWRAEGKVDPSDADQRFESLPRTSGIAGLKPFKPAGDRIGLSKILSPARAEV